MNSSPLETLFLRVVKTDGRSTVRLFEATPTPLEEKNLGKLFAIIELDLVSDSNEHIIDLVLSRLTDAYYASEQFEIEAAFEHALHRLNEQIATIVGEVGEDWLKGCNAVFGVVHGSELVFAHSGAVLGLLSIKKQLVDIIEPDSRIAELNPLTFFGNVISGQLPDNGSVFFGTDAMMDYLSRETVRRILEADVALDSITEFQSLLSVDTHDRNFIGMLMRRTETKRASFGGGVAGGLNGGMPTKPAVTAPAAEISSGGLSDADSMSSLMDREQETAELLTSSVWPTLKKSIMEYAQGVVGGSATEKKAGARDRDTAPDRFERDDVLASSKNAAARGGVDANAGVATKAAGLAKQAGVLLMAVLTMLSRGLLAVWGVIVQLINQARGRRSGSSYGSNGNGGSRRSSGLPSFSWGRIRESVVHGLTALLRWFGRLTILQKVFVVLALVVLVVFSQSVVTKGLSNGSGEQADQYAEIMNQVDVKINEGKAADIRNGDSRTKYAEAKALLATIPKDSKVYKERGEEIEKVIATELQKSNKISDLGELQPVVDYSSISSDIRVRQMMLLGASLYAFDANNGSVYRGNLENNEVTATISAAGSGAYVAASKASPGTGMVLGNNVVSTFNPVTETITNANLSFSSTPQSLVDVTVFGNRVYTLDTGLNQIVRNRKNGEVFQGGENWLTDSSASVRDGVAMAIDGAVYVLNKNGSVSKFEGGKKANFTLATVDPALNSGVSIATDENATNLYVADRDNKRVVVFKKTGELVNQYSSASFDGMVDIVVDEPNKKIYVLTETGKVYQVTIQ